MIVASQGVGYGTLNTNQTADTPPHTLIPLTDFKAILGIDDRENSLSMRRYSRFTLKGWR
jgi:hypothetical protein